MAYNEFLFQFGNFVFPNKHIKFDTYDIAPDQRMDEDSHPDGNGETIRNVLEHTKTNITFTTNKMSENEMNLITAGLAANYILEKESDAICNYFNPRMGNYKTGHFYLDPSVRFRIMKIDGGKRIRYGEMQWIFIEY